MRALAIETAGRDGSVALVDGGVVVAESAFPGGLRHAAGLLPLVDRLTRDRRWRPADLDHLYLSAGPGSFTGLRVGVTVAKTLALATGVKLVAVPSLAVLVENAPESADHAVVVLDAKRGQIFTARFERTPAGWAELEPPHLDALAAMLERSPRPVYLLGDGLPAHLPSIAGGSPDVRVTPEASWRPRAGIVARLGMALAAAGRFTDADRLVPVYVRQAEAEEKWQAERDARPV